MSLPTAVFACSACGHAQSDDLPEVAAFYDTAYRISLDTEDHDQIITDRQGNPVFRTQLQAELVLQLFDPQPKQRILDFGAAKAATLKRVLQARNDIEAFVFDVSDDYRSSWRDWLAPDHCATYDVPQNWAGSFDVITAHFVIEHVAYPIETLSRLRSLLKPGGRLLVSVPSVLANPGDLVVVDHLNHFSPASLERALALAGFGAIDLDDNEALPGALLAIASNETGKTVPVHRPDTRALNDIAAFWNRARTHLLKDRQRSRGRPAAIFGAGFYGTWIASTLAPMENLRCFIDNNPHLASQTRFERPIISPQNLPDDVELIYVGLNPSHARQVIERCQPLHRPGLQFVWL